MSSAPPSEAPAKRGPDGAQRKLFDVVSLLGVRAQGLLLRRSFHWWYRRQDPWQTADNDYDRERFARTLELLPGGGFTRVLDVGCGEGLFARMVAERHPGADVLGVDVSARAVERARAFAPDLRFEVCETLNDRPEGTFDLIVCAETLYYLGRDDRLQLVADKLVGLLDPGGVLVLVHPSADAARLHRPFGRLLDPVAEYADTGSFRPYVVSVHRKGVPE